MENMGNIENMSYIEYEAAVAAVLVAAEAAAAAATSMDTAMEATMEATMEAAVEATPSSDYTNTDDYELIMAALDECFDTGKSC